MLIIGLLVLAAAVAVGSAGIAANTGHSHLLNAGFDIFGYHLHGSSGRLFLAGLAVGVVGALGLAMTLDGLRRGMKVRRELGRARREVRNRPQAPVTTRPVAAAEPAVAAAPDTAAGRTGVRPQFLRRRAAGDGELVASDTAADRSAAKGV